MTDKKPKQNTLCEEHVITPVANGFIVAPQYERGLARNNQETFVFQTPEALGLFIRARFLPVGEKNGRRLV